MRRYRRNSRPSHHTVASDPNATVEELDACVRDWPYEVLENIALPLMTLEDPLAKRVEYMAWVVIFERNIRAAGLMADEAQADAFYHWCMRYASGVVTDKDMKFMVQSMKQFLGDRPHILCEASADRASKEVARVYGESGTVERARHWAIALRDISTFLCRLVGKEMELPNVPMVKNGRRRR